MSVDIGGLFKWYPTCQLWDRVGYITSASASPALKSNIAFAYVRREHNEIGTELVVRTASGDLAARIVPLPFTLD